VSHAATEEKLNAADKTLLLEAGRSIHRLHALALRAAATRARCTRSASRAFG
jgi:hypothetical protein